VKLSELSTSARKISHEVNRSYKTILRPYDILRRVLVEELAKTDDILKGELGADKACFGGTRCKKQDHRLGDPGTGREGLGEFCSGCLRRESYDRDGEEGEERLHHIHRQVVGI